MRLLDTSAWIEKFIDGVLRAKIDALLPDANECVVPALVQFELAKWFARERGEEMADQIIAFTSNCLVVPLDTRLALRAADVARQHRLATADAIVYATALETGAQLVTCDAHFNGLADVLYFDKSR